MAISDLYPKDTRSILIELIEEDGAGGFRLKSAGGNKSSTSDGGATIASSIAVQTFKVANSGRKILYIVNDSATNLYIKYGAGATTSDYTIKLSAQDIAIIDDWTGIVTGIWDSVSGSAKVTELS